MIDQRLRTVRVSAFYLSILSGRTSPGLWWALDPTLSMEAERKGEPEANQEI